MKLVWYKVKDRKEVFAVTPFSKRTELDRGLYHVAFLEGARKWQALYRPTNWKGDMQFLFKTDAKGIALHDTQKEAKQACALHFEKYQGRARSWEQLNREDIK